jgi:hypothetical protein
MTALLEAEALFMTADGQLRGAPRDPDLILTLECDLVRVLDLTVTQLYADLGTSAEELVSSVPSRFILNAHKRHLPPASPWMMRSTKNVSKFGESASPRVAKVNTPPANDMQRPCPMRLESHIASGIAVRNAAL